jgi:hypothetical protein
MGTRVYGEISRENNYALHFFNDVGTMREIFYFIYLGA